MSAPSPFGPQPISKDAAFRLPQLSFQNAAMGFILGSLAAAAAKPMNLLPPRQLFNGQFFLLVGGILGMALFLTRLRVGMWIACGMLSALILVVVYTPFMEGRAKELVRYDKIHAAPAVVTLSSDVLSDGTLSHSAQDRLLSALELVKAGYAKNLVVTRISPPQPSGLPFVKKRMALAGIQAPVYEVGPCDNTHDEAIAVAQLANQKGWKQILLITSPLHTRRAGATFEKTGLKVMVKPARDTEYLPNDLRASGDRISAFRDWLRESTGWIVYRNRGWL